MYYNIGIHDELKSVYDRVQKGDYEAYDDLIEPLYKRLIEFFTDKYNRGNLAIKFPVEELPTYVYEAVYEYIQRVKTEEICYTHEMFGKRHFNMYVNARKCVERHLEKAEDICATRKKYLPGEIYDACDAYLFEENPDDQIIIQDKISNIKRYYKYLTTRERQLIEILYDFKTGRVNTIRYAAKKMGISKINVQTLRKRTFEHLYLLMRANPYFKDYVKQEDEISL